MANNIAISITADVADLAAKRAIMSAELKAATKDLNAFAKEAASSGSTAALREGMLASATAAEKAKASIAQVNAELKSMAVTAAPATEHVEHGFSGVSISAREMGIQLRESVGMFGEMREAAAAFAEVFIAAFALERVAEWAKQFGEASEKVEHLAQTFGVTTAQIQGFKVLADTTGISIDTITKGLGILDKNLVTSGASGKGVGAVFQQMGVTAADAKDQMGLLIKVADKFAQMDDGPKKVALAMELFGKSGKDLIPILNMGSDGLKDLRTKAEEYGAAFSEVSDSAQAKGLALADAIDETAVAWQGVTNVLGDAFAPILTEVTDSINLMIKAMIDSYREGGAVAVIFEAIGAVIEVVGAAINAVIGVFSELWTAAKEIVGGIASIFLDVFGIQFPRDSAVASDALNDIKMVFIVLKDAIIIAVEIIRGALMVLIDWIRTFARVANDAFRLDWGAIDAEWKAGTDRMARDVETSARRIASAMAEAKNAVVNAYEGKPVGPQEKTGIKARGGGSNFDPDLKTGGKEKKPKAAKSRMADWEEKLEEQKLAIAEMIDQDGQYHEMSKAAEAAYWDAILKKGGLSHDEQIAVQKKFYSLKLAILKEQEQAEEASIQHVQAIRAEAAQTEATLAKLGLQQKLAAIDGEEQAGRLSAKDAAQQRAALNAQIYQLDSDLEIRLYAMKRKALEDELLLQGLTRQQRDAINRQIETLEAQHLARMRVLEAQNGLKMQQDEQKVLAAKRAQYAQMARGYGDAIAQMITFQKGFGATLDSLWKTTLGGITQAISRMVSNWITAIATGTAAEEFAHLRLVAMHAKTAAAAAWKAVVGIPIIGPILAPVAAATAFAGVMAFSAEGGAGDVPYDNAPFLLHKSEMVLPAALANPLRDMLSGGDWRLPAGVSAGYSMPAANNNAPAPANAGGDTHNWHYNDYTEKGQSEAQIMAKRHVFAKAVRQAHREGAFAGAPVKL